MFNCPLCERSFNKESGLKRHITRSHNEADPQPSGQFLNPDDEIDITLNGEDREPLPTYDTPQAAIPRQPKRKKAPPPSTDSNQITQMLLMVFDGLVAVSLGPAYQLNRIEHEYIDPALQRCIDRYLPATMSDEASKYADVILLGFGLSLWGMRTYQMRQMERARMMAPPNVGERLEQRGTMEHSPVPPMPPHGPLADSPEAAALRRMQQAPANSVNGEIPIGVTVPVWGDDTGMVDDIPQG